MNRDPRIPTAESHAWVLRVRVALEHSVRDIDASTRSHLTRMRHTALDRGLARRHRISAPARWLSAGVLAMALAALALRSLVPGDTQSRAPMTTQLPQSAPSPSPSPAPVVQHAAVLSAPDFDLVSDAEQLALLQDLEFYAWMDEVDADGG